MVRSMLTITTHKTKNISLKGLPVVVPQASSVDELLAGLGVRVVSVLGVVALAGALHQGEEAGVAALRFNADLEEKGNDQQFHKKSFFRHEMVDLTHIDCTFLKMYNDRSWLDEQLR